MTTTKRKIGMIDATPTWRGVLPIIIAALESGTSAGKQIAREELARMADLADEQVKIRKSGTSVSA